MQTKTKTTVYVLVVLAIMFTGCTRKLDIPASQSGVFPRLPSPEESTIIIPLSVGVDTIMEIVSNYLPRGEIYNSGTQRDGNTTRYSYSIHREQDLSIMANDNELRFEVPLTIKAKGSYTACVGYWHNGRCCSAPNPFGDCLPGITQTEHGDTDINILAHLISSISLNPDYSMALDIAVNATLTNNPHLRLDLIGDLIRINIPIRNRIEPLLNNYTDQIDQEITNELQELFAEVQLRERVKDIWTNIQAAIPLGDTGFWLKATPKKLYFENVYGRGGKLNLSFGIGSFLDVSENQESPNVPLPQNLTIVEGSRGGFSVYLPVKASFERMTQIFSKAINGMEIEEGGHLIEFTGGRISGLALEEGTSALLVELKILIKEGLFNRTKGNIYVTGIPAYDRENQIIYVSDFKLTSETNHVLVNEGLPWLTNQFLYKDVLSRLRYDFSNDHETLVQAMQTAIEEIQLGLLAINGKLDDTSFEGIHINSKEVTLLLSAQGSLTTQPISLPRTSSP